MRKSPKKRRIESADPETIKCLLELARSDPLSAMYHMSVDLGLASPLSRHYNTSDLVTYEKKESNEYITSIKLKLLYLLLRQDMAWNVMSEMSQLLDSTGQQMQDNCDVFDFRSMSTFQSNETSSSKSKPLSLEWGAYGIRSPSQKKEMQDIISISSRFSLPESTTGSSNPPLETQIFCLADGHGSREAPIWITSHMQKYLHEYLSSTTHEDIDLDNNLDTFTERIREIFKRVDREFCDMRKEQYLTDPNERNDGCTLNVMIILSGWIITGHIGDSRSVIAASSPIGHASSQGSDEVDSTGVYSVLWSTKDHDMNHAKKIQVIEKAGGEFRAYTSKANYSIMKSYPSYFEDGSPRRTSSRLAALRKTTSDSFPRVSRPESFSTEPYHVQIKHMNMTDSMGDVVMKLEPALFEGEPDIHAFPMSLNVKYLIIMASDGLWGALYEQESPTRQVDDLMNVLNPIISYHEDDTDDNDVDKKDSDSKSDHSDTKRWPCTDPIEAMEEYLSSKELNFSPLGTSEMLKHIAERLCWPKKGLASSIVSPYQIRDDMSVVLISACISSPSQTHSSTALKSQRQFIPDSQEEIVATSSVRTIQETPVRRTIAMDDWQDIPRTPRIH